MHSQLWDSSIFYGVGLKKDEQKGKKILQEAVQKGNMIAVDFIKNIE